MPNGHLCCQRLSHHIVIQPRVQAARKHRKCSSLQLCQAHARHSGKRIVLVQDQLDVHRANRQLLYSGWVQVKGANKKGEIENALL
ncbi:hypothetical protein D3C87_1922960 [compost metagenome]